MNQSSTLGLQVCDGVLQYVYQSKTGGVTTDKYSGYSFNTSEIIFLIDRQEDIVYYFKMNNLLNQIHIIKRKANLKSVSVFENPQTERAYIGEIAIQLETPIMSSNTSYITYNFDNTDNCLYIFAASSDRVPVGGAFQLIKIKFATWEVTNHTVTNTSDSILRTSGRFTFAHNGYIVLCTIFTPYIFYKLQIDNSANITKLSTGDDTISSLFSPTIAINNRIYYDFSTTGLYIMNLEDLTILKSESNRIQISTNTSNRCYTPVLNEPFLWYCSGGSYVSGYFMMLTNYLATINNLAEPVTKTADKTMKITYIIQEE